MKRGKDKIKYWVTTDLHLGHDKMKESGYRPSDFEIRIIMRHIEAISEQDVLICLGDVSFYYHEYWHYYFNFAVPCKKWLIRGNHDKHTDGWYLKHGWDFVSDFLVLKRYGYLMLFTHKPAYEDHYLMSPKVDWNPHGHVHNLDKSDRYDYSKNKTNRNILVSLEQNNYRPVRLRILVGK